MIGENSMIPLQPNEIDIIRIPNDIPAYEIQDYDLFDEKDRAKYIKDLERFVRCSFEYRNMIAYLREYMNMRSCAFMPNINNENSFKVKIEIHHSPITLYDICVIILNKRMSLGECLDIEAVAYEVMYIHYSLMLGLIPLCETVHELVHNQYIFVPVDKVYGYYRQFIAMYYNYIDPELLDKLDELERLTIEGSMNDNYKQVLEKKYISVEMGDNSQIDQLHDLQKMLKERLAEYKNDISGNTVIGVSHPDNIESVQTIPQIPNYVPAFVKVERE